MDKHKIDDEALTFKEFEKKTYEMACRARQIEREILSAGGIPKKVGKGRVRPENNPRYNSKGKKRSQKNR